MTCTRIWPLTCTFTVPADSSIMPGGALMMTTTVHQSQPVRVRSQLSASTCSSSPSGWIRVQVGLGSAPRVVLLGSTLPNSFAQPEQTQGVNPIPALSGHLADRPPPSRGIPVRTTAPAGW